MKFIAVIIARLIRAIADLTWREVWWLIRTFLVINGIFAVAAFIYLKQPYRLIYNDSWSMPKGLWVRDTDNHTPYRRGDQVQARYVAPDWIRKRGWYDPLHTTVLKNIAAVPGDRLKIEDGHILVCPPDQSCQEVARRLATDGTKTPMKYIPLPDVVPPRQYLLIGDNPRSLDSRYLGLFGANALIGHIRPLWTRAIPASATKLTKYQRWADEIDQHPNRITIPETIDHKDTPHG